MFKHIANVTKFCLRDDAINSFNVVPIMAVGVHCACLQYDV